MKPKRKSEFFQNAECEYFPCHTGIKEENFSCLFCYCPFYFIECQGTYAITDKGIKDCTLCTFPHHTENYKKIINLLKEEINKRKVIPCLNTYTSLS